jgi:hypothetical protein
LHLEVFQTSNLDQQVIYDPIAILTSIDFFIWSNLSNRKHGLWFFITLCNCIWQVWSWLKYRYAVRILNAHEVWILFYQG